MSKIFLCVALTGLFTTARTQDTAMRFVHNESWENILHKAKADNKYIFVDCYATWCGPCKKMVAEVFSQKAVGDFYNAHYINVKAQMDSSSKDNEDVKARYADWHGLLTKYDVRAYPSYLIFNPDGELVQKFIGYFPVRDFIHHGEDALVPEKQYYTQLRRFEQGERAPEFLYDLAKLAASAGDRKNGRTVLNAWLQTQPDLYTADHIRLLLSYTQSSRDKGFEVMMQAPEKVDAVIGQNQSTAFIIYIITAEQLTPTLYAQKKPDSLVATPDWKSLQAEVEKAHPSYAGEVIATNKVNFYRYNKQWEKFGVALYDYMQVYGDKQTDPQKNDFAWEIYEHCPDPKLTAAALEWSKKSLGAQGCYACMDTYAHLLMRSGRKAEAIEWETNALNTARENKDPNLTDFESTLNQMKGN